MFLYKKIIQRGELVNLVRRLSCLTYLRQGRRPLVKNCLFILSLEVLVSIFELGCSVVSRDKQVSCPTFSLLSQDVGGDKEYFVEFSYVGQLRSSYDSRPFSSVLFTLSLPCLFPIFTGVSKIGEEKQKGNSVNHLQQFIWNFVQPRRKCRSLILYFILWRTLPKQK